MVLGERGIVVFSKKTGAELYQRMKSETFRESDFYLLFFSGQKEEEKLRNKETKQQKVSQSGSGRI